MRNEILLALLVPAIAFLAAEATAAPRDHHNRAKDRILAGEQWRNRNASAAPAIISVPSYGSNLAEGAMTSGIAGH
ncbi:hypothetical protein [Bradyrhizobium ivorense]|uniref:hypothetical protein n=1 Tax=Bradyrhizobium ivorense TaxID=2511166 RepID=UPI00111F9680|nr:hypothetical protein [Bradyrhizobium ivorense]